MKLECPLVEIFALIDADVSVKVFDDSDVVISLSYQVFGADFGYFCFHCFTWDRLSRYSITASSQAVYKWIPLLAAVLYRSLIILFSIFLISSDGVI